MKRRFREPEPTPKPEKHKPPRTIQERVENIEVRLLHQLAAKHGWMPQSQVVDLAIEWLQLMRDTVERYVSRDRQFEALHRLSRQVGDSFRKRCEHEVAQAASEFIASSTALPTEDAPKDEHP